MKRSSFLVLFFICLLFISNCSKTEEEINEYIIDNTIELINYNWQLNNIKIDYEEYQQKIKDFFIDNKEYNDHLNNSELSPIILENVRKIDKKQVEKSENIKNYDIISGKISKVYNDTSGKKYVYVHMVIAPHTPFYRGSIYTSGKYNLNEERNLLLIYSPVKNNWKISDIQANAFLENLKDKLSNEFVNRYTQHENIPVEYIKEFDFIN